MKRLIILMLLIASNTAIFAQKAKEAEHKKKHAATARVTYSCPVHSDVTSAAPGKCSKCNRDLTLSKKEQMKMEVMKLYSCPNHPEVTGSKAGKCPKCGMELAKSEPVTYVCPMHPDVTSAEPGKCPKCNMDLNLSKKEQMKMEVMKIYTCSMHPEVTSDKPGKCTTCGMALEKKKDKE